jgi:hypothetical protein
VPRASTSQSQGGGFFGLGFATLVVLVVAGIMLLFLRRGRRRGRNSNASRRGAAAIAAARRANDAAEFLASATVPVDGKDEGSAPAPAPVLVRVVPLALIAAANNKNAPRSARTDAAVGAPSARGALGLFLTRDAILGQCLLAEPPLFVIPPASSATAAVSSPSAASPSSAAAEAAPAAPEQSSPPSSALAIAWSALDSERQHDVRSFDDEQSASLAANESSHTNHESTDDHRSLASVVRCNALPTPMHGEANPNSTGSSWSMFLLASRANHSCVPMAEFSWSASTHRGLLYPCAPTLASAFTVDSSASSGASAAARSVNASTSSEQPGAASAAADTGMDEAASLDADLLSPEELAAAAAAAAAAASSTSSSSPSPPIGTAAPALPSALLPKRTEVTISYLPDSLHRLDYLQRQRALQQRFGFRCACATCLAHGRPDARTGAERNPARVTSDSNRRRIASLETMLFAGSVSSKAGDGLGASNAAGPSIPSGAPVISSLEADPSRAADVAERIVGLLIAEGFAVSTARARVHARAADILLRGAQVENRRAGELLQRGLAFAEASVALLQVLRAPGDEELRAARQRVQRVQEATKELCEEDDDGAHDQDDGTTEGSAAGSANLGVGSQPLATASTNASAASSASSAPSSTAADANAIDEQDGDDVDETIEVNGNGGGETMPEQLRRRLGVTENHAP